ncbi:RHS repeat-associated protein [Treponema pedis]
MFVGNSRLVTAMTHTDNHGDNDEQKEKRYYYHSDHLGSAQFVTDWRGKQYEHIEYTPYGELWIEETAPGIDKLPFRFTGKELDEETGLYYYGARYLDPKYSRWLSRDPALNDYIPKAPVDDEAKKHNENLPGMGGVFNTVNLHVYHYAGNNPVKYIDPDGRTTKVTVTNIKVSELSKEFRNAHGLLGKGEIRIVGSNGLRMVVDTYLMTVTDDKTNKKSYYEVTRHAPTVSDNKKLAFNPDESVGKYYGMLRDGGKGVGEVLELWNNKSGRDRNIRADITGDGKADYIQIHVGGVYTNLADGLEYIGGSLGCLGLNGKDKGNSGRDKFMKDIHNRLNNSGGRIEIYIQKLEK